ncbi:MAG: hypothetical protein ACOYOK_12350 [Pseudobdellovibrionaceae bacterium]
MNKKFPFIIIVIFMSVGFGCWATYFQSDYMSAEKAEKKWGVKQFNKDEFKNTIPDNRAPFAVDIVKKSMFVGKSRKEVRAQLGDPDSYFFSDTIYAYKIMPFPGENKENWHLVFIPDDNLEKVKEVKIHKKCCYKLPF